MTPAAPCAAVRRAILRTAAFALSMAILLSRCAGEALPCTTLRDAWQAGLDAEEKMEGEIHLILPSALLDVPHRIHDDKGREGVWDADDAVWNMIYLFPSVYKMSYAVCPRDGGMKVDLYFYYRDGVRLLRAYQNNGNAALSEDEAAALAAAERIAGAADASLPPRERLLRLCEALCGALAFLDPSDAPEGWDVKTCVTALSRGRANCQGYADAFFLCASLAGFDVKYQNGWTRAGESHTWNRVLWEGTWLDVDLTWMDAGEGITDRYFLADPSDQGGGHVAEESQWPLAPEK